MILREKNKVLKVNATSNEFRKMKRRGILRVPIGTEVSKGRTVDVYCRDSNTLHQFLIKSFVINENHILVRMT